MQCKPATGVRSIGFASSYRLAIGNNKIYYRSLLKKKQIERSPATNF
ncbi:MULTISPECIES: hypothetical protein [unclassified Microcoleus]